jgi:hypothetical protein
MLDLEILCPIEYGVIENDLLFFLKKYYAYCGFIVCKLNENQHYYPFAYSHTLISKGQIFIPTRHYKLIPNLLTYPNNNVKNNVYQLCQWDLDIYSYNTHSKSGNCKMLWKEPNYPKLKIFDVGEIKILNKYKIIGMYPNQDFIFNTI